MKKNSKAFLILGLILICILGCFSYVSSTYNKLIIMEENVESAWSNVQDQYQRRLDLIPQLMSTIKGAAVHEAAAFKLVTEARKSASAQINVSSDILNNKDAFDKYLQSQDLLGNSLSKLIEVAKTYPVLTANQNFLSLQDQLDRTEKSIKATCQEYNEVALIYNSAIRKFPTIFYARKLGFQKKAYIQLPSEA